MEASVTVRDTYCSYPDHLADAITVLENMRVTTEPMQANEMTDIEQRRVTALDYLRLEQERRLARGDNWTGHTEVYKGA